MPKTAHCGHQGLKAQNCVEMEGSQLCSQSRVKESTGKNPETVWAFCRRALAPGPGTVTTVLSFLIPKGNDLLCDKELDGLLLPVIHIAVQFICVHSSSQL